MTSKIILKKSSIAAKVPVAGDLEYGELALNYTDGILYYKNNVNAVAVLNPTGGGGGGTVTSVAALTLGTTGTDVSSTVANSTTTPVITLNLPSASATNRGLLSSTDWTTFNNKQPAGSYLTAAVTSIATAGTVSGLTLTGGTITSTGTITLGGTLAVTASNFSSQTANTFLAAPNGTAGTPTFRTIVAADIPTLNQDTTGNAGTVTNGVYTTGSYADPAWITSLAKSKVGLTNVENTALSTWVGSTNIVTIGAATASSLTVTGDLTVNGTTTTINSTTLSVDDKNIELGSVTTPSDSTANGGGITLKGTGDKTFNWLSATAAWTSSEHLAVAAGKNVIIGGATSGSVTLAVPAVSGSNTITFPAVTGNVVTTGDTATVTNAMLAGSIANTKLTNSSVTVGSTAISLGGSSTTLAGLTSVTSTSFVGALTGNADTVTSITSTQITTGLGFTPYNATNPSSYIALSSAITGYTAGTNTALAATDTLLAALGKLQGQVTARGVGTVTSVAALTLGTTGTDVSSTVATGTSTPVITLNLPTASATNRGLLSSADWTTFNNKQPAGSYLTTAVTSLSFGTTGLTPNTGTTGAITVAGTLVAANGGTGLTSPGASGNVLTSNGTSWVSSAPTGGGGGGITYTTQTANYTAAASQGILANTTSGSFTVTLPATPTTGASVIIADPVGTWSTNSLIVARNGSTISGLAEDITLDLSGAQVTFIYNGTTWGVYAQVGGNGGTVITNSSTASLTNKTLVDPILTLTGTQGTAGQIPLSQGSSQPPVWSSIKTINSVTVTGSGNIAVQPTLVSGTNIKSINGVTLLGSGDLVVTAVSATGTATIDFGAFPGTSSVNVVVTGQTLMSATAKVRVFINGDDTTTDHNAEDHRSLPLFASFVVGAKVAGTGFTIYSRSLDKLQGTFKITWEWIN